LLIIAYDIPLIIMPWYNADLHIHTCLSPCGSLEMSPRRIIARACERGMQVIAITDHNSTRNVQVCMECGAAADIMVIPGCEVNTQEEVHCLCYFPHLEALHLFQEYLDRQIIDIPHDPERFGYQVAVDADEQILFEESRSLFTGISDGIEALEKVVHRYGGLFVPAHIDRQVYGILSQLGFIPQELSCDALELSRQTTPDAFVSSHPELERRGFLQNSDAHRLEDIGSLHTRFQMEDAGWDHFRKALLEQCFEATNVPPVNRKC